MSQQLVALKPAPVDARRNAARYFADLPGRSGPVGLPVAAFSAICQVMGPYFPSSLQKIIGAGIRIHGDLLSRCNS
jgi:hypothetical protein